MQIVFGKGKKSKHGFIPVGYIAQPETDAPLYARDYMSEEIIRFYKRKNTLKAILRRIEKQNYEKGTTIFVPNWYVGYADLYIIV